MGIDICPGATQRLSCAIRMAFHSPPVENVVCMKRRRRTTLPRRTDPWMLRLVPTGKSMGQLCREKT